MESSRTPFDKSFDQLREWPYGLHAIEDSLDRELIEGRARQIMFRALNNNNLVAFVGTGVSAAYGRMDWAQLRNKQINEVKDTAERFIAAAEKAKALLKQLREHVSEPDAKPTLEIKFNELEYQLAEIKRLQGTFLAHKNSGSAVFGGEIYPIQFQIAKRLQDALQRAEQLFIARPSTDGQARGKELDEEDLDECWKRAQFGFLAPSEQESPYKSDLEDACTLVARVQSSKKEYQTSFERYFATICRPGANLRFKDFAKYLVYDECPHAEHILTEALRYGADHGRAEWNALKGDDDREGRFNRIREKFPKAIVEQLRRNIPGINEDVELYEVLGFFKKTAVEVLLDNLRTKTGGLNHSDFTDPTWISILDLIHKTQEGHIEDDGTRAEPPIWTPTRRFIVGMIFAKLADPLFHKFIDADVDAGHDVAYTPIQSTDFRSRESLIREDFDPLRSLMMGLDIRRFLTTNYDLEIERVFADRGYRMAGSEPLSGETEVQRVDPLGGRASDSTFKRRHTSDLVSFSLELGGDDASVFHLHGRATGDSEFVLTERDYMDLYLRADDYRDTVDEAIDLAMSANPVLFVGLGMSEDDVLRPLRQFVSNQERRWDRTAIALLESSKGEEQRRTEASVLYVRYGVHALFYGDAEITVENEHKTVEWLRLFLCFQSMIWEINSALQKALTEYSTGSGQAKVKATSRLQALADPDTRNEELGKMAGPEEAPLIAAIEACPPLANAARKTTKDLFDVFAPQSFLPRLKCQTHPTQPSDRDQYVRIPVLFELELLKKLMQSVQDCHGLPIAKRTSGGNSKSDGDGAEHSDAVAVWPYDDEQIKAAIRTCHATRIGLEGLRSSVRTAFLSAEIRRIQEDWQAWWGKWQRPPYARRPKLAKLSDDPKVYLRHQITPKFSKINPPTKGRRQRKSASSSEPTGIRAFDTFLEAVQQNKSKAAHKPLRRQFIVAAHRGLGKGVFMSAFSSEVGMDSFAKASWTPQARPAYLTSVFINYSFSTEVTSTWDMLKQALIEAVAKTGRSSDPKSRSQKILRDEIRDLSRRDQIATLLHRLKRENGNKSCKRVLVCFNAIDLLLNDEGDPKNAEISAMLDLLCGERSDDVPLDLIMIGDETRLPSNFLGENQPVFNVITRPGITGFGMARVQRRLQRSRFSGQIEAIASYPEPKQPNSGGNGRMFLHFCRVMQPEVFLKDNFELLSALLFYDFIQRNLRDPKAAKHKKTATEKLQKKYRETVEAYLKNRSNSIDDDEKVRKALFKLLRDHAFDVLKAHGFKINATTDEEFLKLLSHRLNPDREADGEEPTELFDKDAFAEWRMVRDVLRFNRFSFTIILSAAEFIALQEPEINNAKAQSEQFIRSVIDHVKAISEERREEIIVSDVLDAYEPYHRVGNPKRDVLLHLSILRHLAVVGQPISPDVLVRMPEIQEYFSANIAMRMADETTRKGPTRRTKDIRDALDHLERCGLVFRLEVQPQLQGETPGGDDQPDRHRYALHRLIHRHVMRKMGGPMKEFLSTNSFAPTMFGSMPSDLPRPNETSYLFLRRLVAALSEYPDRHALQESTEPWHFSTADYATRVQAVRSALGVVRSTFSLAVVSRFQGYSATASSLRQLGCFEEHRVQLRWLIRKAGEMTEEERQRKNEEAGKVIMSPEQAYDANFLKPFYQDEIVWLYNECGLTCMIQGNLRDAVALFRNALRINERTEGRDQTGPSFKRISLNLVIAQIERGSLSSARELLRTICREEPKTSEIWMLAEGYLGLINHLRGQTGRAEAQYQAAMDLARVKQDHRALAIFARHAGDLRRLIGDFDGARTLLQESMAQAESGGHEDLLRRTQLAMVKLNLAQPDKSDTDPVQTLREVYNYAEAMDMPGLSCEAMHVRAGVMLDRGEMTLSGKLLKSAIAEAKRNGMQLRMISALAQYGVVAIKRRQPEIGRRILMKALDRAKSIRCQLEIDRIERALLLS